VSRNLYLSDGAAPAEKRMRTKAVLVKSNQAVERALRPVGPSISDNITSLPTTVVSFQGRSYVTANSSKGFRNMGCHILSSPTYTF